MNTTALNKINNLLKGIPDDFVNDVINYLDFLYFKAKEKSDTNLTNEQKQAIDEGLNSLKEGKGIPHEQVMEEMKKRHPKYFK